MIHGRENCLAGLVVRASASLAGGRGFNPRPRQTKVFKTGSSGSPPWRSGLWEWHYDWPASVGWLAIPFYLSSLPVAHLSDATRRWLVVTGDSARIQDETTESCLFFNVIGV